MAVSNATSHCLDISREIFTQETFDDRYVSRYVDFSVAGRLKENVNLIWTHKKKTLKRWALTFFPPLHWMREYNWKVDLLKDSISGLTVGVMNIPQGMAYGMLAGLPPVYGLYTSFYLPLVYAFFGTSLHMSVGVFAVISLMVATAVDKAAPLTPLLNQTDVANMTTGFSWFCGDAGLGYTRDTEAAIEAAVTLTFLVGLCQCLFGFLQMGFLSVYLSDQLVEGLTTGSAVLVLTSQIGNIFGIRGLPPANGVMGIVKFYGCFLSNLTNINWTSVFVSLICMAFLIVVKECIDPHLRRKYKVQIPSELLVLIFATIASHYGHFGRNYRVNTVGKIPTGLQPPRLPSFSLIPDLITNALSTSVVIFSIGVSIGKLFGKKHDYEVNANQEWFALGLSHFVSSFFSCHCGGSSLTRSVIQEEQGSKSQIASIIGAVVILLVLLALAPLFEALPSCALGAIIVVNLKGMFMQLKKLPPLWKRCKTDFMIWIVSLVSVILLDISLGLGVAVLYALLTVVFCSQWPDSICLGQFPGTELYKGLNAYKNVCREEGLRAIIIDCSPFPYVDMTGLDALRQVYEDYNYLGIRVAFACVKVAVRQMMIVSDFFERVPKSSLYPSVHDAVCELSPTTIFQTWTYNEHL